MELTRKITICQSCQAGNSRLPISSKSVKIAPKKNKKLATALTQRCANAVASQFAMRTQSSANARPA